jgi:hypothetical protein
MAILPTKLMSATFLPRISFLIIVGKRDIRKLFVFPSSQNRNNFNYHGKIYQHLPLPLNQKPRHLNLPLRLSPPRVIIIRMLKFPAKFAQQFVTTTWKASFTLLPFDIQLI